MQPQTSSSFRQRLGYYLTGVAIGFAILGFFWLSKHQAQLAQQAEQSRQAPSVPAGAPAPSAPAPSAPAPAPAGSPQAPAK